MSVKTMCWSKEEIDWNKLRQKVHEDLEAEQKFLMSLRSSTKNNK